MRALRRTLRRALRRALRRTLKLETLEHRHLLTVLAPQFLGDVNLAPQLTDADVVRVGDRNLLVASDEATGIELYSSDGTEEGTRLWKDLTLGPESSNPRDFHVSPNHDFAFFRADLNGRTAWLRTDGNNVVPISYNSLRILQVASHGAYFYELTSLRAIHEDLDLDYYLTDLWFVDGNSGAMSLLQSYENYDDEAGLGAAAVRDDGTMLFQFCAKEHRDCTIGATDGTLANTFHLADFEQNQTVYEVGDDLYFGEYGGDAVFRYIGGLNLESAGDSPAFHDGTAVNQHGFLANDDGTFVVGPTLNSEPILTGLVNAGVRTRAIATESSLLVLGFASGAGTSTALSVDPTTGETETYFDFGQGVFQVLDSNADIVTVRVDDRLYRTDGTAAGTWQIPTIGRDQWTASLVGNDIWIVSQIGARSVLEVHTNGQTTTTVGDLSVATRGVRGFDAANNGALIVAYEGETIWFSDDLFATTSSVVFRSTHITSANAVGRFVVYRTGGQSLWSLDTRSMTHVQLNEAVAGLNSESIVSVVTLGDRVVMSTRQGLWISDGTVEGTHKYFDDLSLNLRDAANGILIGSNGDQFYVTDGTTDGTYQVTDEVLPLVPPSAFGLDFTLSLSQQVWQASPPRGNEPAQLIIAEAVQFKDDVFFTTWLANEQGYGLFHIRPGWDEGTTDLTSFTTRYNDMLLASPQIDVIGNNVLVLTDDGLRGAEVRKVPMYHRYSFSSRNSITCGSANAILDATRLGSTSNNLEFDVNNDSLVNEEDFDAWNQIVVATGDVNLDGNVDAIDLNTIGQNWNRRARNGWCDGDVTGDGMVDADDLNQVGVGWNTQDTLNAPSARALTSPLARQVAVISPADVDANLDVWDSPTTSDEVRDWIFGDAESHEAPSASLLRRPFLDRLRMRRASSVSDDAFIGRTTPMAQPLGDKSTLGALGGDTALWRGLGGELGGDTAL